MPGWARPFPRWGWWRSSPSSTGSCVILEKKVGSTTTAVVLDRFSNRYLIHLEEYLLEVDMPATPGREFEPGDQVLVRIEKSNARSGTLKIVPV